MLRDNVPAQNVAGNGSEGPPGTVLPIRIEKSRGVPPGKLFGGVLLLGLFCTVPLLIGQPLSEVLFHSTATYFDLILLVGALALYLLGRTRDKLAITPQGVGVVNLFGRWFYGWTDIERVIEYKAGVRVFLKGRSDEQNGFNFIPSFGLDPSQLQEMLADGIARYGNGSNAQTKTVAPGDDLNAARKRRTAILVSLCLLIFGTPLAIMVVPALFDCLKGLELQKNGRATQAVVVRIYTSVCGRSSCSENVEYAFKLQPSSGALPKEYRGYQFIGTDRYPHDPDMIYAKTNRTVPIVYDVNWPEISSLNFRNRVFTQNPLTVLFRSLAVFGGIWAAVIALAVLGGSIRRARKASN
jgi:hypothetical protein